MAIEEIKYNLMGFFRFRKWFEAKDQIAKIWSQTSVSNDFINDESVNEFTERMSDNKVSAMMYGIAIRGRSITSRLYNEPISENLLYNKYENLGNARGIITTNINNSFFGFYMLGNKVGNMDIIFQPTVFEDDDVSLLRNIIRHECVHAYDWAVGTIDDDYPLGDIKFDVERYAKNLYEIRAIVTQLKGLLNEIKDKRKLIRLLANHPTFGVNANLLPIISQYIINEVVEGIGKLIVPIATMGALMEPSNLPTNMQPIIKNYDQNEEIKMNRFVSLASNTVKLLKFGNFIKY